MRERKKKERKAERKEGREGKLKIKLMVFFLKLPA